MREAGEWETEGPEQFERQEEQVKQQIAGYSFEREDRDGEVRLLFHDVPAADLASSFRRAGATLITLWAERIYPAPTQPEPVEQPNVSARRRRKPKPAAPPQTGEVLMRYAYVLGELVYTVGIAVPSGVVQSVARIYPAAALSERQISLRVGVVFSGQLGGQ